MTKRIFVSQSEFDLGRNRHQRRLEAGLDKNQEDKIDIKELVAEQILPEGTEFCEYIEKCRKPCFKKPNEYCGVRSFLNKWGLSYII